MISRTGSLIDLRVEMVTAQDKKVLIWLLIRDQVRAEWRRARAKARIFEHLKQTLDQWTEAATNSSSKWWTVLGCEATSSHQEIKEAYRKACLANHPDRGGSKESMHRINQALEDAERHIMMRSCKLS